MAAVGVNPPFQAIPECRMKPVGAFGSRGSANSSALNMFSRCPITSVRHRARFLVGRYTQNINQRALTRLCKNSSTFQKHRLSDFATSPEAVHAANPSWNGYFNAYGRSFNGRQETVLSAALSACLTVRSACGEAWRMSRRDAHRLYPIF